MAIWTYEVGNGGAAISTAITILQIKAGAAAPLEILRCSISQKVGTASVLERIGLIRKSAAATVTSVTPLKMDPGAPTAGAAGGTAATGKTGSAEGTDTDILVDECWNVANGNWIWLPTPEERIIVPVAGFFAMKFLTAPASQTWYASIKFREFV